MSITLALLLSQAFQQGPMEVGHRETLSGVVIGTRVQDRGQCWLVAVDPYGTGGRFIYCPKDQAHSKTVNSRVSGSFIQVDRGLWRMGPRLRVLPLYTDP